jgi:hypothetical protein
LKFVFIAKHRNVWPVASLCNASRGRASSLAESISQRPIPAATKLGQQVQASFVTTIGPAASGVSDGTRRRMQSASLERLMRLQACVPAPCEAGDGTAPLPLVTLDRREHGAAH